MPTIMLADIAPADLIAKLQRLTFGTCDCRSASTEVRDHAENCCYRLAIECVDLLASTPAPAPPTVMLAQEVDYAIHHGWPRDSIERLTRMRAAA